MTETEQVAASWAPLEMVVDAHAVRCQRLVYQLEIYQIDRQLLLKLPCLDAPVRA